MKTELIYKEDPNEINWNKTLVLVNKKDRNIVVITTGVHNFSYSTFECLKLSPGTLFIKDAAKEDFILFEGEIKLKN